MIPCVASCDLLQPFVIKLDEILLLKMHAEIDFSLPQVTSYEIWFGMCVYMWDSWHYIEWLIWDPFLMEKNLD